MDLSNQSKVQSQSQSQSQSPLQTSGNLALSSPLIGTDIYTPDTGHPFTPEADEVRLKSALKKLGLSSKKNFMPYLDFYNVVEIYRPDGFQLYSNGRFFEITSLSKEDVLRNNFNELFERSQDISENVLQEFIRLFKNSDGEITQIQVPEHTLRESMGEKRLIKVQFLYGTSLFNDKGDLSAILITLDAEVTDSPLLRVIN